MQGATLAGSGGEQVYAILESPACAWETGELCRWKERCWFREMMVPVHRAVSLPGEPIVDQPDLASPRTVHSKVVLLGSVFTPNLQSIGLDAKPAGEVATYLARLDPLGKSVRRTAQDWSRRSRPASEQEIISRALCGERVCKWRGGSGRKTFGGSSGTHTVSSTRSRHHARAPNLCPHW